VNELQANRSVRFRTRGFRRSTYLPYIGGDGTTTTQGNTTMTKILLATAVLFGSASLALAQALPQYDGDANQISGAYHSVSTPASADFTNAFASSRPIVQAPAGQLDGDGNLVPGAR
jgi:hypothetical protein